MGSASVAFRKMKTLSTEILFVGLVDMEKDGYKDFLRVFGDLGFQREIALKMRGKGIT